MEEDKCHPIVKSISYEANDDGTFKVIGIYKSKDGEIMNISYPRVKVKWYSPARTNYFAIPIPEGFEVLTDKENNIWNVSI